MSKKKIYTVATSHLDTIWSWDFETTVSKYIYNTLVDNISMFKKYPTYIFSFEGSYRYELMEEYYPELFEEMKEYIKQGRWNVTGSSFENGDVNVPSPEALFRNILLGNGYFDKKFGKRSVDIYLPDCFGFGWALPSVAAHANLMGFTTQKLSWGSAYGVPFDIGKWYGVNGDFVYGACNCGSYDKSLSHVRGYNFVEKKIKDNEQYNLDITYLFHGIGDRGGSAREKSVAAVDAEIKKNGTDNIEVIAATADQIFRDIDSNFTDEQKDKLPVWKNELVMKDHAVGGYTSRSISKRWNRRCEELAEIAEKNAVVATALGVGDYNQTVIDKGWKRCIAHQFHDDIPGTSVQRAYRRSWNDYALSMNQFTAEAQSSLAQISSAMDSSFCKGVPVMVSNPMEFERVQAVTITLEGVTSPFVRVYDNNGVEVKSQVNFVKDNVAQIVFVAQVAPMGYRVYDVRQSDTPCGVQSDLKLNEYSVENQKYIVTLNKNGDISSIVDKQLDNKEILKEPVSLGLFKYKGSSSWPAWELNYKEVNKQADRIPQVVSITVAENGPARVTLCVKQKDGASQFVNYVALSDGGNVVEVYSQIEWRSMRTLAKQKFSFNANNDQATYDLGLGAIKRGNMNDKLFEVPAQKWADITDKSGEFGVSVISECKYGWDKFDNNTLRLTVLHTPRKNYRIDSMQSMMDLGLNRYSYAIFSHPSSVGVQTQKEARTFIQPMPAVVMDKHQGAMGSNYSFITTNNDSVIIRAIKKAQDSDLVVVRINEGTNNNVDNYTLSMGKGIKQAVELYASEEYKADAVVCDGKLVTSLKPYEVKTFALILEDCKADGAVKSASYPADVDFDKNIITKQNSTSSDFELTLPKEIMPSKIVASGAEFTVSEDCKNALVANAQVINLQHNPNQIKVLCTSLAGDKTATFFVDDKAVKVNINDAFENYAAWDLYDFKETAYVKDGVLGFEATHTHKDGNDQYAKAMYFWVIDLDTTGAKTVTLPKDSSIVVIAVTEVVDAPSAKLVTQMYDKVQKRPFTYKKTLKEQIWYLHSKCVWMINDKDNFLSHNNNGKDGKRIEQSKKRLGTAYYR